MGEPKTVDNDEAVRVLVERRAYFDRELERIRGEAETLARRQDFCINNRKQICQALLAIGADPNQPPEEG